MSWNNALPMWVWNVSYERFLGEATCAFPEEWYAGTSREMPQHVIDMSPATFKTWEQGGWNHNVRPSN